MRSTLPWFAIAAITITSLTGCASPLEPNQIDLTINIDSSTDRVLGDELVISLDGSLADAREDEIVLRVESSTDGSTWVVVEESALVGPDLELKAPFSLIEPGIVRFRGSLLAGVGDPQALATTESLSVTVHDISTMIRDHYYNRTQAYTAGTAAGVEYDIARNYPGVFDDASAARSAVRADLTAAEYRSMSIPDLNTISETPTWLLPGSACNAVGTEPLPGRTFIVSVEFSDTYNGFPDTVRADVHVTLLDGELYHYVPTC